MKPHTKNTKPIPIVYKEWLTTDTMKKKQKHRLVYRLTLLTIILLIIILASQHNTPKAGAHQITSHDCKAITHYMNTKSVSLKKAVSKACNQHRLTHTKNHKLLSCTKHRLTLHVKCVIRVIFAGYAPAAIRVAKCESSLNPSAKNGQYLGLFQMGKNERAKFGHGKSPAKQTQSAYNYFKYSNHTWRAWSCKP